MLTFTRADNMGRESVARSPNVTAIDDENEWVSGRPPLINTVFPHSPPCYEMNEYQRIPVAVLGGY